MTDGERVKDYLDQTQETNVWLKIFQPCYYSRKIKFKEAAPLLGTAMRKTSRTLLLLLF